MTAPYKKRALAGWNGGKANKTQSNRDERQVEDLDIADQTAETTTVRKKTDKKKKNTLEKKILRKLRDARYAVKILGGDLRVMRAKANAPDLHDWSRNYYQRMYQSCRDLPKQLDLWLADESVSTKIKKQIVDVKGLLGDGH